MGVRDFVGPAFAGVMPGSRLKTSGALVKTCTKRVAGHFRESDLPSPRHRHSMAIGWGHCSCMVHTEICMIISMKTTLDLNDQLLADAKALAAQQRTSLTRLIEEGLHLRLRAKAASAKQGRVRLPVFKGRGGLVSGVDPLSNKALLEALGDDA